MAIIENPPALKKIENPPTFNQTVALLNIDEMKITQELFIDVFDALTVSYVTEGDASELANHLADLYTSLRLHTLLVQQSVNNYTDLIMSTSLVRDFHLELSDRLSSEIAPLGSKAYSRLINTLATGITASKAEKPKKSQSLRSFDPVLTSIDISYDDARSRYFENPWLVGLTLIARWFKKTTLAEPLRTASNKRSTKQ